MLTENNQKKSRIVILGARGFIGSAIAKKCLAKNLSVLTISREDVDLEGSDAAGILEGILRDGDSVVAAAAVAPVKNSEMLTRNLKIVEQIVIALRSKKISYLLNISSDAVYADSMELLTEDSVRAPQSLHGVMHLARELCFETLSAPAGILCPTLVYGLSDPHNGYGPNSFSRLAKASKDIDLFGKGEELRDHIFIDDVAEIGTRMIDRKLTERINVASGKVTSFSSIASSCLVRCNSNNNLRYLKRSGPMPHNGYRAFDISKLKLAFPDFIPTALNDGLETLFNAEKK